MAEICYSCGQNLPKRPVMTCDECGAKWSDGIDGCPKCGNGNPFRGIGCLTPVASQMATSDSGTGEE